jgi:uroporphyrin-III C-methyltransferase / precorrin-2 dehydrogenase / sirohydrochlorin ferrochelatase
MTASLYPVFLKLDGKRVLVVGGGNVAAGKVPALLEAGALVTVVAPRVVPALCRTGVSVHERPFAPSDLDGVRWVVAAATPEINRAVSVAADARGIFVNAVDDLDPASAYLGGVVRKGGVTVAISTGGGAPALAGLLREALERVIPDDIAAWLATAREERVRWRAAGVPMAERRPLLLRALNELYARRDRPVPTPVCVEVPAP